MLLGYRVARGRDHRALAVRAPGAASRAGRERGEREPVAPVRDRRRARRLLHDVHAGGRRAAERARAAGGCSAATRDRDAARARGEPALERVARALERPFLFLTRRPIAARLERLRRRPERRSRDGPVRGAGARGGRGARGERGRYLAGGRDHASRTRSVTRCRSSRSPSEASDSPPECSSFAHTRRGSDRARAS